MRLLLIGALAVLVSGCTGMVDAEPIVSTPAPPRRIELPPKKQPVRELGSLWDETSVWNDVYSDPPKRVEGDVILVKLSENFRRRVLRRLKREYPIRVKSKIDIDDKKNPVKVAVEKTSDKLMPDDTLQVYATVIEVLPRFVYRLAASETIRVGGRDPVVTFEGEVRERDIRGDDAVSTDNILNLALDLKPYGRQRRLAQDGSEKK